MPRFFADKIENPAVLAGDDAQHISRSLRMKAGEELILCDKAGFDYRCRIESLTDSAVICAVLEKTASLSEPDVQVTLYQAFPKADKFETILQKSVELGAVRIVPVLTARCVARPDEKSFRKKLERLEKISLEAAKQSGRGIIPEIGGILSFKDALAEMSGADTALMAYEKGGERLDTLDFTGKKNIAVLVGSEGGFEPSEAEAAKSSGVLPVWLGNRILRCETAPLALLSILMHKTGNM